LLLIAEGISGKKLSCSFSFSNFGANIRNLIDLHKLLVEYFKNGLAHFLHGYNKKIGGFDYGIH
jgi:hypothetical protein